MVVLTYSMSGTTMKVKSTNSDQILIYQAEDGKTRIEVRFVNENVWLTQMQIAELFQKDKRTISEHIRNIFKEGELSENSVVRNFRTTAWMARNT